MAYTRFIAIGDSITEGLSDEIIDGNYRGWADRVADVLATQAHPFTYVNLAVRGKKLEQVIAEQIPVALPLIEGPQTVVSFHAGANNALRPGFNPETSHAMYRDAVRGLAATGATLLLFTVQEVRDPKSKLQRMWNERFCGINENVRNVAREIDAIVLDGNQFEVFYDSRLLGTDRLHLNSEGHRRVAAAVLEQLNLPHDTDWKNLLPPPGRYSGAVKLLATALWAVVYLLPWILRRISGRSSGDGRVAKYPNPISWPR